METSVLQNGRWDDGGSFDDKAVARVAPFPDVELAMGRLFLPKGHKTKEV